MAGLRVLTFNFHEPYLWLMAQTGYAFTVGQYTEGILTRSWHLQYRPIPPNMVLMAEEEWRAKVEEGYFDVIIAHNESNAFDVIKYTTPKILVCHNRKTFLRSTVENDPEAMEAFEKLLAWLAREFRFVFISESKRADYGFPGDVILPGIDVDQFGGYTGIVPEVLRVGNMMRARNLMFDVDFQEQVLEGLPNRVVGQDPDIVGARESASFQDLLRLFRTRRCLLHVTRQEYEDGYNLSTLEAMACGMPVVSLANQTSPITNGIDGYTSFDVAELHERIEALLNDRQLARDIGARGRDLVAAKFPISAFIESWRRVIEEAVGGPKVSAIPVNRYNPSSCYREQHPEIASVVPLATQRLLDVGCGCGDFGRLLKQRGISEVYGIESDENSCAIAAKSLDKVLLGNIETLNLPFPEAYFDCIVCNSILERFIDPAAALQKLVRYLAPDGLFIASISNVRFYEVVAMLASGRWRYEDEGILNRAHLRFFTLVEMGLLVADAGLELLGTVPLSRVPLDTLPRGDDGSVQLDGITITLTDAADYADLCTRQYLIVAGVPNGDRLSRARNALLIQEYDAAYALAAEALGVDDFERKRILALAAARSGRLSESEQLYREIIELKPQDHELRGELGILLVTMDRPEEAIPLLEKVIPFMPANPRFRGALGLAKFRQGCNEEAYVLLREAIEDNLDAPTLLPTLAALAESLGRIVEVEDIARRYAEFYSGNTGILLTYARLLIGLGRLYDARQQIETALLFAPNNIHALQLRDEVERIEELNPSE